MGKNQQLIKLFFVLFIGTTFIFGFSHYGVKAFEKITNIDGEFSEGTTIGPLNVSGKTEDEAISLLEEKYLDWLKKTSIELQYGEKTAPFNLNQFHLDAQQTVNSMKDGQLNPAIITVDKVQVEEQLGLLFPQIKTSDVDADKLTKNLNSTAALFEFGSQTIDLFNGFLLSDDIKKESVVNTAVVEIKDIPLGLQSIIEKNPEIEIAAESTFSLLEFAKKQKIDDIDSLNLMATGIYQVILPSNFSIVERNINSSLPDYSSLGFEAKVNPIKKADFVITNPNKAKYILTLHLENNQLKVEMKGEKLIYTYKISTKDEQKLAPKTIIQYSPLLLPGKTKIQTKGEEGQIVKVYREIYQGDQLIKTELISEDYYPPIYQVEIHGLEGTQETTPTIDSSGTQVDTTNQSVETTTNNNHTATTSDPEQQDTNESKIWGNTNEQPK
ncbi:G5 domain-containing protein [Bacillaceae bacterium C204]|uniref:G5 domain-containing protein n=1 Tax=Neobacillus sp. 204 TaxID=3383351 RepID=UPI00397ADF20